VHAGDVGSDDVLAELQTIAPVLAIAGNMDSYPLTTRLPSLGVFSISGQKLIVVHDLGQLSETDSGAYPIGLHSNLRRVIAQEKPRVVVFGHTHRPAAREVGGVLYLNPGSATVARHAGVRIGVGLLLIDGDRVGWKLVPLDAASGRGSS
jgi:putative phosphoesterase